MECPDVGPVGNRRSEFDTPLIPYIDLPKHRKNVVNIVWLDQPVSLDKIQHGITLERDCPAEETNSVPSLSGRPGHQYGEPTMEPRKPAATPAHSAQYFWAQDWIVERWEQPPSFLVIRVVGLS